MGSFLGGVGRAACMAVGKTQGPVPGPLLLAFVFSA